MAIGCAGFYPVVYPVLSWMRMEFGAPGSTDYINLACAVASIFRDSRHIFGVMRKYTEKRGKRSGLNYGL
jgi:hypothetical protein